MSVLREEGVSKELGQQIAEEYVKRYGKRSEGSILAVFKRTNGQVQVSEFVDHKPIRKFVDFGHISKYEPKK